MMLNRMRIIVASLALLLAIAHVSFGIFVFKAFNLEAFWFCSFGLAMAVTALANFAPETTWVLRVQNALTLSFICALAILAPQVQVLLGCVLLAGLFTLSCFKRRPTEHP